MACTNCVRCCQPNPCDGCNAGGWCDDDCDCDDDDDLEQQFGEMPEARTEVKTVLCTLELKCEQQVDNTLDDPYVLSCMGVVVSGKSNEQAVKRLEDELNKTHRGRYEQ